MLFLFRNIQFTTAITVAVYVVALHLAAMAGVFPPVAPMETAGLVYEWLFSGVVAQPFWSAMTATVLVFIQAVSVNRLADTFRLLPDRNWLPGMGYALVASALPDFQFLSPPLVAATFVIVALDRVFQAYKLSKSTVLVFDAAFWMAVGSLFYPKALFLGTVVFIGIGVMRSWSAKDRIAFFAGISTPLFLAWIVYFWADAGSAFRTRHFGELFDYLGLNAMADWKTMLKGCFLAFFLLFFAVNFGSISRNKTMHAQKCITVLYWLMFMGAAILFLERNWQWEVFILGAPSLGIFLALTLQGMRKTFAELLHIILFATALGFQFFCP